MKMCCLVRLQKPNLKQLDRTSPISLVFRSIFYLIKVLKDKKMATDKMNYKHLRYWYVIFVLKTNHYKQLQNILNYNTNIGTYKI